jgi:hypothetical protein
MTDHDTALREVAALVWAGLRYAPEALEAQIRPIADRLGLGEDDGTEVVAAELRKALGLKTCLCGISPGAPSEVIPPACPVHGIPCGECGGLEACKPGCGDGYAPVDSGMDSDGTPWAIAASDAGLIASVGAEDVLLKGAERDRFAEAVARAVTPGRVTP